MNKLSSIVGFIFIFCVNTYAEDMKYANMGYLVDGMDEINSKDGQVAFKIWADEVKKDYNIRLNTIYYDSVEVILKDYKEGKINQIALNAMYYLENQKAIDSLAYEYWSVRRDVQQFEHYVILVRNEGKIKTLKDLKNVKLATRSDSYISNMYLDVELLKATGKDSKRYIGSFVNTARFSTAVLKTFFGNVDVCVVPEYTFQLVAEMNPAIKTKLKVLKRSEEIFLPMLAIFHKNIDKEVLTKFRKNIVSMKDTARGNSILELFRMKGYDHIPYESIKPLKDYYSEYNTLREKYVK